VSDDFFDDYDPNVVQRDGGGRPLIKQADGTTRAYTRASSLGDYLTDQEFLTEWKLLNLAVALGRRPDLADQCAVEPYNTGFDEPDQTTKRESKKRLLGLIRRALDAVKIDERADRGTVVHAVTETGYDGYIPVAVIGEYASFQEFLAINGIVRLGSEVFVVNDELRVAGTFDHLWYVPAVNKIRIGDTKNGRNQNNLGFGCQFANYANSEVYDPATGERMSLEEFAYQAFLELGMEPERITPDGMPSIDREVAILASVKENEVKVSEVDIAWGYEQCKLAAAVRDARGSEAGKVLMSKTVKSVKGKAAREIAVKAIEERIKVAPSVEYLNNIWRYHNKIWTPELTNAAAARKGELE
jgi:hypothetical protein